MKAFLSFLLCFAGMLAAQQPEESVVEVFPTWGHIQSYEEGMSFNFRVEKNRLRVYFIDKDGVLIQEPVVKRITVRVNPRGNDPEFLPLNFDAGLSAYTNPKFLRRPFVMQVKMALIGSDDKAIGTYQFFLSQQINSLEDLKADQEK